MRLLGLSPAMRPAMLPHELLLTGVVLLVWAIIIRHFLRTYKRITFVNSLPLAGYLERKLSAGGRSSPRRESHARYSYCACVWVTSWQYSCVISVILSSAGTALSKSISKTSIHNQFELLEEALHKWRSETILGTYPVLIIPIAQTNLHSRADRERDSAELPILI